MLVAFFWVNSHKNSNPRSVALLSITIKAFLPIEHDLPYNLYLKYFKNVAPYRMISTLVSIETSKGYNYKNGSLWTVISSCLCKIFNRDFRTGML